MSGEELHDIHTHITEWKMKRQTYTIVIRAWANGTHGKARSLASQVKRWQQSVITTKS